MEILLGWIDSAMSRWQPRVLSLSVHPFELPPLSIASRTVATGIEAGIRTETQDVIGSERTPNADETNQSKPYDYFCTDCEDGPSSTPVFPSVPCTARWDFSTESMFVIITVQAVCLPLYPPGIGAHPSVTNRTLGYINGRGKDRSSSYSH
jgi:hypothetical protein